MANAVIPRQLGDSYQASIFWIHASKLYQPHTNVYKVEWEANSSLGFDDVVVHYNPPILEAGGHVVVEKYQVKFHVDHKRAFTCEALIDPSFIGTVRETILGRLHALYVKDPEHHRKARYYIINTWGMDSIDDLRELVGNGGAIRLEKLFDGTTETSRFGRVRKLWKEHLGIATDDELAEVLRPLRIRHNYHDEVGIREPLNLSLQAAGLKPIPAGQHTTGYTELIQRLHAAGQNTFTKEELLEICRREGLLAEKTEAREDQHTIGIRSFLRGAEYLDMEVDALLCLLHCFSGRFMNDETSWNEVFPQVNELAEKALATRKPICIHLDTHLSIALLAGYCLDFKYGAAVSVIQKTIKGRIVWRPGVDANPVAGNVLQWDEQQVNPSGNDIVLAVSITHEIAADVFQYVQSAIPSASRILHALIQPSPSTTAIRDGNHIISAVHELIGYVRKHRTGNEKVGHVHLFLAAPNAFAFFLGQHVRPLGKLTLYEFDFGGERSGSYHAVINLPVNN